MVNDMIKKLFFILMWVLLYPLIASAGGVGDPDTGYVTNLGSDLTVLAADNAANLATTGTTSATERAIIFRTINGTRRAVGAVNISFRNESNSTSNASLANLGYEITLAEKKVIFNVNQVGRASGTLTIYMQKYSADNAIVVCEGATLRGNVGLGCAYASEVTKERTIYPVGDTGSYAVTTATFVGIE